MDFTTVDEKPMIVWAFEEMALYFKEAGDKNQEKAALEQLRIGGADAFEFIRIKSEYLQTYLQNPAVSPRLAALSRLALFFLYYDNRLGGRVLLDSKETQELGELMVQAYRQRQYSAIQNISIVLINQHGDFDSFFTDANFQKRKSFSSQVQAVVLQYSKVLPETFLSLVQKIYHLPD